MAFQKYIKDTKNFARYNRQQRNMTHQEGLLWNYYLKNAPLHFYRQYRVGNYILDFYCPKKHLCIEIDGSQHYEDNAVQYDEERTKFLKTKNIKVIRFYNKEIDTKLKSIVEYIKDLLK